MKNLFWTKNARSAGLGAVVALFIVAGVLVTVSRAQDTDHKDKAVAPKPRTAAAHDDHEGHDHADEEEDHGKRAKRDEHDDHDDHEKADKKDDHDEHADHDGHDDHDEDAEHADHDDHDDHDDHEKPDEHAGHDHGDVAEEPDDHAEEGLTLSAEERRHAGLVIAKAGPGDLKSEISIPGEVSLNEDRVAHVVPLVGGIVREVRATVGDHVKIGDVLAVLDSSDLGEAKLDYLTKINEILCCNILVPRAQAVHDNTLRLLAFLDGEPSLEDLRTFKAAEAGENLKTLIGAYAQTLSARQTFEREKGLHAKAIASEQDYLTAKTEYEKATAEYLASRDSIAFEIKRELAETTSELRAAKFEGRTSEQRLRLMGIEEKEIHTLDELVLPEDKCAEPNCTDCKTGASADEQEHYFGNQFARYEVRAPASGIIVEKHIVRGERVGDDADVFTIADMGTVWINLTVHLKDLHAVHVGAEVVVRAEHSGHEARGRIAMLSPVVDTETRTAIARLVLENDGGNWRPGVFVVGRLGISAERLPVVVPKNAVQTVEGKQVVFVPEGKVFEPVPVRTGRSDRERIEITAGLAPGTPFVVEGAYELKAKLVTSSLDSHAGHGH
ncbi:MAG: efflux RND transporter periplasmic adaptor subunit [Lentisphaeria bacterium]|nr:efflux RND transporter periplasmic adaptor subunit [Lentisphaeria bacterium]